MNALRLAQRVVALSSILLVAPPANADVWVAADGTLAKVASDGRVLRSLDSAFGRSFAYCIGSNGIIAVSPLNGHLWVADVGNDRILELNADGQPLREIAVPGPIALAIDPNDGGVWAAFFFEPLQALLKLDPSTGERRVRVTGFRSVQALAVARSGRLWAGDRFRNEVVILSGTDEELDGYDATDPTGPHHRRVGGFDEILDLDIDPTSASTGGETCWVADRNHGDAVKLAPDGAELVRTHPTGFFDVNFVSVDVRDGSAWFADPNSSRLAKLTPLGSEALSQSIAFPTALAVDAADNAVWLGTGFFDEARVRKLDTSGQQLLSVGAPGGRNSICSIVRVPRLTVIIDGCDSGAPNAVLADGRTISDHVSSCASGARNHGQFVQCVAHMSGAAFRAGAITAQQKGAIQQCAGQAGLP
jgi:DNA-binding beta-propeller fold protein YncE